MQCISVIGCWEQGHLEFKLSSSYRHIYITVESVTSSRWFYNAAPLPLSSGRGVVKPGVTVTILYFQTCFWFRFASTRQIKCILHQQEDDGEMLRLSLQTQHTHVHTYRACTRSKKFIHIHKSSLQMFEEVDEDENSWRTDGLGGGETGLIWVMPVQIYFLKIWQTGTSLQPHFKCWFVLQCPTLFAVVNDGKFDKKKKKENMNYSLNFLSSSWLDCKYVISE